MKPSQPIASLSLDLDNKWSYMKTHGDAGWQSYPSYLDTVVPRFLDLLAERDLTITVMVVGRDAALKKNHEALAAIADAGHEIGNHSFHHEPWLHLYSEADLDADLARAEEHIQIATGVRPEGFRGPGFSYSPTLLRVLTRRGYAYDASTFPTFLGPLARFYYFLTAKLDQEQKKERSQLFGAFSEGFLPLRPYRWDVAGTDLIEIPVTTMPVFKVPIHVSYLLYLAQFARLLAVAYFRFGLALCGLTGVTPSLLLHPLDFLGSEDDADLAFFPAMGVSSSRKIELVGQILDLFRSRYAVTTLRTHAATVVHSLTSTATEQSDVSMTETAGVLS